MSTTHQPRLRRGPRAPLAAAGRLGKSALLRVVFLALSVPLAANAGSVAPNDMCSQDVSPAATLLVPYFEVNLDDPLAEKPLVYLHNATPEPTLLQVTLWTDWGLPSLYFNIFLTGYDLEGFDLADLFLNGNLPITADQQSDGGDFVSPHGDNPEWDGSFTNCENFFPFFVNPLVTGSNLERIRDGHTGQPVQSEGELCLGENHADNIARGWVTIDVVERCSLDLPSDPAYWQDPNPVLSTENRIFGDLYLVNPVTQDMSAMPLVHLQADPAFDAQSSPSGATFYGRFATGGADHREPLGSAWSVSTEGPFFSPYETELWVWRDPTVSRTDAAACGVGPDWKDLPSERLLCFDDQENPLEPCNPGATCFPLSTQAVSTSDAPFFASIYDGWCYLDLGIDDSGVAGDVDFPGPGGTFAQAWVGKVSRQALPAESVAVVPGYMASSACDPVVAGAPALARVFADGFDTGDTSRWSIATP